MQEVFFVARHQTSLCWQYSYLQELEIAIARLAPQVAYFSNEAGQFHFFEKAHMNY